MCLLLKFAADRVLGNVPVTGHVFCADAVASYQTARDRGLLEAGDRYLVAAVGSRRRRRDIRRDGDSSTDAGGRGGLA